MALGFDERGLLPEGLHLCDERQFSDLLVKRFPEGSTRAAVRDGFFEFRQRAAQHGICGMQWVDGSYVTKKLLPSDVDVVTFVAADHVNNLSDEAKLFVQETMARPHGALQFKTDSYVVVVREPGHPAYDAYERWRLYWRDLYGHTRPIRLPDGSELPRLPKGMLSMGVGSPAERPNVSEEVGADAT